MNQIKCPNCGEVFTIDEKDYESIVKQVKDKQFQEDLKQIEKQFQKEKEAAIEMALSKAHNDITKLEAEITKKDSEAKLFTANEVAKIKESLLKKDDELKTLNNKLKEKALETELKVSQAINEKEGEIVRLKANNQSLIENYKKQLSDKDEIIAYYKDFKARQSTKMIGEDLEQHCLYEFNRIRPLFKNAYFAKDNDASDGSKGDFIFRDYDDEKTEIVSIMFEMKNEADETATKHKNEDFLAKLDKDRNTKKCEYAVLVSLLEMDNETYNEGIVDMSYKYPKMYVIRPQNFITIITLLRNANLNSLDYKKQLVIAQNQDLDFSHFEENMNNFKDAFGKNYELASRKFNEAIDDIDRTIKALEKTKADLLSSDRNLRLANDKAQSLSIDKLTKNAPSVKEKLTK